MKLSKLTKPELEEILENANLTEDEQIVFDLLSKGKTITEISLEISVCERTVNRRISKIKNKINRLEGIGWLK
jgi:DNA-binding NarL/FixJ family response regulator